MVSEIEIEDENPAPNILRKEVEKIRIRQIINYQKSLYLSSSSSASSSSASASSLKSNRRSLLELMREGSAPLKRLWEMEHTSLQKYFKDYSASPLIRPILLWGSNSDDDHDDPWAGFSQTRSDFGSRFGDHAWKQESSCDVNIDEVVEKGKKRGRRRRRQLYRTNSYKRLPGIGFWRCGRLRFKLRFVKRLRLLIRGRLLLF